MTKQLIALPLALLALSPHKAHAGEIFASRSSGGERSKPVQPIVYQSRVLDSDPLEKHVANAMLDRLNEFQTAKTPFAFIDELRR